MWNFQKKGNELLVIKLLSYFTRNLQLVTRIS